MAVVPGTLPGMGSFHLRFTPLGWRLIGAWGALWAIGFLLFLLPDAWLPFLYMTLPDVPEQVPLWHALLLNPPGTGVGFQPWQVVTGPLLYPPVALGGWVLGALGIGFFGGTVERFLGKRRYLELWGVSLLGAVALGTLYGFVGSAGPHYGFGPVVLALIVIHCLLTPEATVTFFLVMPVKMKWIGYGVAAIVLARALGAFAPFGGGAVGGYELGGLLAGVLWWRYRDDLDPRAIHRRRKAKRLLRAVEDTITGGDDGPVYH